MVSFRLKIVLPHSYRPAPFPQYFLASDESLGIILIKQSKYRHLVTLSSVGFEGYRHFSRVTRVISLTVSSEQETFSSMPGSTRSAASRMPGRRSISCHPHKAVVVAVGVTDAFPSWPDRRCSGRNEGFVAASGRNLCCGASRRARFLREADKVQTFLELSGWIEILLHGENFFQVYVYVCLRALVYM